MGNSENTKNSFLKGAFIIALSNIIIKLIGAVYKIPLDGLILKTEGMGIYSSSYTIYNTLFIASTAGIPVAISKLVSEARVSGRIRESKKILSISVKLLMAVGFFAAALMFFGARFFSDLISAPSSYLTMMVMAPSLFFVAMSSCYRGYYQGQNNMVPTAISEVIEAMCKLVFGLFVAYFLMKLYNEPYIGSAGAMSGITLGTIGGFLYLYFYNRKKIKNDVISPCDSDVKSTKEILKSIVKLAVPVTLGVSVFTLTSVIDTGMIMNQLAGLGFSEELRTSLYGYLNRAITLFNLPPTIISAIAISIVPAISASLAIIFAVPCAAGLSSLAKPILALLYNDPNHSFLLNIMGIAVLFVTAVQISNAILQSYGKPWIPVIDMIIGGIVKIVVNLLLVSHPDININGAPIGTTLCYFTVMMLNLIHIKRLTKIKFNILTFVVKPLILGLITAFSASLCYGFISDIFGNTISVFLSIIAGGSFYVVFLFLLKTFNRDEILLIPKGDKILSLIERRRG